MAAAAGAWLWDIEVPPRITVRRTSSRKRTPGMASILRDEQGVPTLPGLMMEIPLTITGILEHAVRNHPRREIVSRDGAGFVRLGIVPLTAVGASIASISRL